MRFFGVLAGLLAAATALTHGTAIQDGATALDNTIETRQVPQCGVSGYRRSNRPYFSRKAVNTARACGEKCWSEAKCNSYSFGQGTCSLFSVELSRNLLVKSYSPIKFYEKSCAAPSPPPTYPKQSCKLTGYDNANGRKRFFTKSSCNLPDCQALCKSKSRCQSYRHGQGACVLFTAPVSNTFTADKRSPFTFYDRECRLDIPAQPTSTTSTRASTTKTSTTVISSTASTTGLSTSRSTTGTTTVQSSTTRSTTTASSSSSSASSSSASSSSASTSSTTGSSTIVSTTTASTTTTSANPQETTFDNVRISFQRTASKKRQDGSVNLPAGYISRTFNSKGQRVFTDNPAAALSVKISVPKGGPIVQTRLNLLTENSQFFPDLPALALVRNTDPAQSAQLFLGAALAGAPPGDGLTNSLGRADLTNSYVAQSAIWTVNLQTFAISAQWINADGTTTDLSLLAQDGVLFMASNPSAFPTADRLTPTANFADAAAACTSNTNYELVLGQCLEKCQAPKQRIPGTIFCAQPLSQTCPEGQRSVTGLCICIDNTKQLFKGTCVPRCDMSLNEKINSTTGQCGCRADMARAVSTNPCQCPTGMRDNGISCECAATGTVLNQGSCICQDLSAVLINGACVKDPGPQKFNNVLLSFTQPAGPTKRQASGSQIDLSYGYISADLRAATGDRYLTNDQQNSLTVSFSVPAGTTTGQQINLVGPDSASPAGLPTLSLLFDTSTLQQGVAFGSSAAHRLSLGSSAVTSPGARPETRYAINSSMLPSRAPANAGKFFAGETAVWTIDTTTGILQAFWIDGTGAKNRMVPMADGDNLFFAPEAVSGQINGTLLQMQAEIPGTPSPGRG